MSCRGFVRNNSFGVEIQAEGDAGAVDAFIRSIPEKKPDAALILDMTEDLLDVQGDGEFRILQSESTGGMDTLISPDLALCEDCRRELLQPGDRRFLYPFINCTNCGPRYTIIRDIPYDRPGTTMAGFTMCPDCQREYRDPADRRYHAQPNACPVCGPSIWLEYADSEDRIQENVFGTAARLLKDGKILAIKGLGGFHLAVNARDSEAVQELRRRKKRDEKAFAIMVDSVADAEKIVRLTETEKSFFRSKAAPIVVADRCSDSHPSPDIAPGNRTLGVMLAYTPLHVILFRALKEADPDPVLVMTSANISEEPIVTDNQEARAALSAIADAYLFHDRDILFRADDSVLQVQGGEPLFFRRSRGLVPLPILVPESVKAGMKGVLGVGAELKNTIALQKDGLIFSSAHIGDLNNLSAYRGFQETIDHFQSLLGCRPEIIAHDMHPAYLSTQWAAAAEGVQRIKVQHHHAHMAACMAENKLDRKVIGIILDGTGYGYDGTIWGGEIFYGDYTTLIHENSLRRMPLPGGDAAVLAPWRAALAYCLESGIDSGHRVFEHEDASAVKQMLQKNLNTAWTSSCGRLFDAVSVLCGGPDIIRYEGQAAIEFMHLADAEETAVWPYESSGKGRLDARLFIRHCVEDLAGGLSPARCSARFHNTLSALLQDEALRIAEKRSCRDVLLSGGVFQNKFLLKRLTEDLNYAGLTVRTHRQLPPNDGGIAAGQCAVTAALLNHNLSEVTYTDERI